MLTKLRNWLWGKELIELDAVRYAAHMPEDYQYGLPSWINQVLYHHHLSWLDWTEHRISKSEDVERIVELSRQVAMLGRHKSRALAVAREWEMSEQRIAELKAEIVTLKKVLGQIREDICDSKPTRTSWVWVSEEALYKDMQVVSAALGMECE